MTANPMHNIPAAACPRCGGWTTFGGMSQHATATKPVLGRTGCTCTPRCDRPLDGEARNLNDAEHDALYDLAAEEG